MHSSICLWVAHWGKEGGDWDPVWRHSFISAAVGGQWTQAMKAAVEQWHIDDNRCHLCKVQVGTIAHRFHCIAIEPHEGWRQPPAAAANLLLGRLSATRKDYRVDRRCFVLKLPAPPIDMDGTFSWHSFHPIPKFIHQSAKYISIAAADTTPLQLPSLATGPLRSGQAARREGEGVVLKMSGN